MEKKLADHLSIRKAREAQIAELRNKNKTATQEVTFDYLSKEEKINALLKDRIGLQRALKAEKDPLRQEKIAAAQITMEKKLQGLLSEDDKTGAKNASSRQPDAFERIGLYVGGGAGVADSMPTKQLQALQSIDARLNTIDQHIQVNGIY